MCVCMCPNIYICLYDWEYIACLCVLVISSQCFSIWFIHRSYICVYAHLYMSMRVYRSELMSARVCTFICLLTYLYCCTLQKETIFFSLASAFLRSQPTNGEDLRMVDIFVPKRSRFVRIPSRLGIHYLFLVSLIFFFTIYSLLILFFFFAWHLFIASFLRTLKIFL